MVVSAATASMTARMLPPYTHSLRIHKSITESPLAPEAPVQNFRGFQNLLMLLLFVNNLRLVVENYLKYGLLLTLPGSTTSWQWQDAQRLALSLSFLAFFWTTALLLEWLAIPKTSDLKKSNNNTGTTTKPTSSTKSNTSGSTGTRQRRSSLSRSYSSSGGLHVVTDKISPLRNTSSWVVTAHCINLLLLLIVPSRYASQHLTHPLAISVPCTLSVVLCMKLASWMLVNYDLRRAYCDGKPIQGIAYSE